MSGVFTFPQMPHESSRPLTNPFCLCLVGRKAKLHLMGDGGGGGGGGCSQSVTDDGYRVCEQNTPTIFPRMLSF